jgi:predicted membrane-bound dolichyl-phosphate-mannose-protein mannosyltransferase
MLWTTKPLFDFVRNIFKMPPVWWPWMAGLPLINLSSVFFLPRTEAWVVLGTGLLAATIMTVLHVKLGSVRLLGIGHFVWIPMLIWLVFRLDHILGGTLFYRWLLTLIAVDTVSLLIDIVDLVRYLRGDRIPRF